MTNAPTEATRLIADIYLRVTTRSASAGLQRQEQVCRDWCLKHGVQVRTAITEIGRAFNDKNKRDGRAYTAAYDSWRKAYWDAKGEPLNATECDPDIVPVPPPNLLVMEDIGRLCQSGVTSGTFTIIMLKSIGIQIVPVAMPAGMTASGPVTFNDDNGISVRVDPDGSIMMGRTDLLGGKPETQK